MTEATGLQIQASCASSYEEFSGTQANLVGLFNWRLMYAELIEDAVGVLHCGGVLAFGGRNEDDLHINVGCHIELTAIGKGRLSTMLLHVAHGPSPGLTYLLSEDS